MTHTGPSIRAEWLGRVPYSDAAAIQDRLVEARKAGSIPDTMLLLEHPHVVTLGRRGADADLLAGPEWLAGHDVEVHHTDRGGEATYHGPGQLVVYPIISIRAARIGPVAYVRLLEQSVIDTLRHFGVDGHRVVGKTGVWVGGEPGAKPGKGKNPAGAKIAAIGVRVSSGITKHGFALNVSTDLNYYTHIVPCGMPDLAVASIETLTGKNPGTQEVGFRAAEIFAGFLGAHIECTTPEACLDVGAVPQPG